MSELSPQAKLAAKFEEATLQCLREAKSVSEAEQVLNYFREHQQRSLEVSVPVEIQEETFISPDSGVDEAAIAIAKEEVIAYKKRFKQIISSIPQTEIDRHILNYLGDTKTSRRTSECFDFLYDGKFFTNEQLSAYQCRLGRNNTPGNKSSSAAYRAVTMSLYRLATTGVVEFEKIDSNTKLYKITEKGTQHLREIYEEKAVKKVEANNNGHLQLRFG